jgi:hypothetical protein
METKPNSDHRSWRLNPSIRCRKTVRRKSQTSSYNLPLDGTAPKPNPTGEGSNKARIALPYPALPARQIPNSRLTGSYASLENEGENNRRIAQGAGAREGDSPAAESGLCPSRSSSRIESPPPRIRCEEMGHRRPAVR